MAFIVPEEILAMLPANTAVTSREAAGKIDAAVGRIAESHAPDPAPDNAVTRDMVEELAYAKTLKLHYIKGEAEIDTKPLDDEIARVEKRFDAYDAIHSTEAERQIESPRAFVQEVPW